MPVFYEHFEFMYILGFTILARHTSTQGFSLICSINQSLHVYDTKFQVFSKTMTLKTSHVPRIIAKQDLSPILFVPDNYIIDSTISESKYLRSYLKCQQFSLYIIFSTRANYQTL